MAKVVCKWWHIGGLRCPTCNQRGNHRIREYRENDAKKLAGIVNALVESGCNQFQILKTHTRSKEYEICNEYGKLGITVCVQCGNEGLYIPQGAHEIFTESYFWHKLETLCIACGMSVEQNNTETVGYCWNEKCNPIPEAVFRVAYRCTECGDWDIGCGLVMRCQKCNTTLRRTLRTAC